MNKSAGMLLAFIARSISPSGGALSVISKIAAPKPASPSFCLMSWASWRLKAYSDTPRALMAPGTSRVWPTSTTTRNAERWQLVAAGFAAAPAGSWLRAGCRSAKSIISNVARMAE